MVMMFALVSLGLAAPKQCPEDMASEWTCKNGCKVYCGNVSGCCQIDNLIEACKTSQGLALPGTWDVVEVGWFEVESDSDAGLRGVGDTLWDRFVASACRADGDAWYCHADG